MQNVTEFKYTTVAVMGRLITEMGKESWK